MKGTPSRPPARICGSASLRGPATAPAGARTIRPGQSLPDKVDQAPAGTTFWLAPGVHHLGSGPYDQVIPKSRDVFIGAPGAVIDGRHVNLYAFGGHAIGVRIHYLTIENFGRATDNFNEGVVNHDAGHDWTISHATVRRNGGAGVFLGTSDTVRDSCLVDNGQYGFSAYEEHGVQGVRVLHNEIARNNTADWESRISECGCTGGGKFWDVRGADISGNWVHDNAGVGLWADTNNTGFRFRGNYLSGNAGPAILYEISYNAEIVHNTFVRNAIAAGPTNPGFPTGAIYLSESGSDSRVHTPYRKTFPIAYNVFVDNWSGVIAWENADRFAGSPANSSTGYATLVNPKVATLEACSTPSKVRTRPYYDDCRWKTRQLRIAHNVFSFHPGNIARCTPARGCGYNGLFSNYGSYPDWSPFLGTAVENHITFHQGNRWYRNTYVGPWRFVAHDQGTVLTWGKWRAAPYRQDVKSRVR